MLSSGELQATWPLNMCEYSGMMEYWLGWWQELGSLMGWSSSPAQLVAVERRMILWSFNRATITVDSIDYNIITDMVYEDMDTPKLYAFEDDYVGIRGSGFLPGESVALSIYDLDTDKFLYWAPEISVDSSGAFKADVTIPFFISNPGEASMVSVIAWYNAVNEGTYIISGVPVASWPLLVYVNDKD